MIILYTSLLVLLVGARFLVRRRAAGLERKYAAVLKQANALLREPHREGNSGKADAYQTAKRHFQLGAIAQKKETLEARHAAWQGRADRLGRWVQAVRAWKGRKLPYLLGGLDAFSALCLVEYLGVGDRFSPRHVVQLLTTWLTG